MAKEKTADEIRALSKRWSAELKRLRGRTSDVHPRQQIEFERQLDLVEAKLELAATKLAQIELASDVEGEALKASLDGIRNEIENALDSASAKLE